MTHENRRRWFWLARSFLTVAFWLALCPWGSQAQSCDPCIHRQGIRLQAIWHGAATSGFWLKLKAAAVQAALELKVELDVTLYEAFDPDAMVVDLEQVRDDLIHNQKVEDGTLEPGESRKLIDVASALIVTLPTQEVADVVKEISDLGMPVFGCNSGYQLANDVGVIAHVAQDDYQAGVAAAEEFIRINDNIATAAFVNHEAGNSGLTSRWEGFRDTIYNQTGAIADEMSADSSLPDEQLIEEIRPVFENCPYDVVSLASPRMVEFALAGFDGLLSDCEGQTLIGSFDVSRTTYTAIRLDKLTHAISQQEYLQGLLPVQMAVQYLTTGQQPLTTSSSSEHGIIESGPKVIHVDNVPSDSVQVCTDDGFPVCPNQDKLDGTGASSCPCTDRSTIHVAGVFPTTIQEQLVNGAEQAALDLGIQWTLHSLKPEPTEQEWNNLVADKLNAICRSEDPINGILASIPVSSLAVDRAVQRCRDADIPVYAIYEGGSELPESDVSIYIGMDQYRAGFVAGSYLMAQEVSKGWCVVDKAVDDASTVAAAWQCAGFAASMDKNPFVTYMGQVQLPLEFHNAAVLTTLELQLGTDPWDEVGLLATDRRHLPWLRQIVTENHPEASLGAIGNTQSIQEGLADGTVAFAVDDQAYLQGYMPVSLLAYQTYTELTMEQTLFPTGPVVQTQANPDFTECLMNEFDVCEPGDPRLEGSQDDDNEKRAMVIGLGVGLPCLFCCCCMYLVGKHTLEQQRLEELKMQDLANVETARDSPPPHVEIKHDI